MIKSRSRCKQQKQGHWQRKKKEHVRTLELTNGSNGKNKKKQDKQRSGLKLPDIPSLLVDPSAMWVQYQKYLDPDRPVPPEGYKSDDESGSGVDSNNNAIGCFSSAGKSSVNDHNDGRLSSADKSSVSVCFSSAKKSSINDHNDSRFSSADKSSVGGHFSSAKESRVIDGHNDGHFSSANESSISDCFSSADKSRVVNGHNDHHFSSANESSLGRHLSSADKSRVVDGHNDGHFSSADIRSVGGCFPSASKSRVNGNTSHRFSSAKESSDESIESDNLSLLSDVANIRLLQAY
jgi:hypothetical protein